jgi:phosphate transport system substrate-binding protein
MLGGYQLFGGVKMSLKEKVKRSIVFALVVSFLLVLAVGGAGCLGSTNNESETMEQEELSGEITIAGSTSVQPVSEVLAEAFMDKNPGVKVAVQGGGSSVGIEQAAKGTVDIGSSSRELKPEEKKLGLQEIMFARDGIAVIVHPSNKVESLTLEQIRDIFAGRITNWKDVGGEDGKIVVINREAGSGTRGAFEEIVMEGEELVKSIEQTSTGAVRAAVASDPNAIGYVSLTGLSSDVKPLKVNGVSPTHQNIKDGKYPIARPFLYLVKGEPSGPVKAYLDFVKSEKGREILEKEGVIPVS